MFLLEYSNYISSKVFTDNLNKKGMLACYILAKKLIESGSDLNIPQFSKEIGCSYNTAKDNLLAAQSLGLLKIVDKKIHFTSTSKLTYKKKHKVVSTTLTYYSEDGYPEEKNVCYAKRRKKFLKFNSLKYKDAKKELTDFIALNLLHRQKKYLDKVERQKTPSLKAIKRMAKRRVNGILPKKAHNHVKHRGYSNLRLATEIGNKSKSTGVRKLKDMQSRGLIKKTQRFQSLGRFTKEEYLFGLNNMAIPQYSMYRNGKIIVQLYNQIDVLKDLYSSVTAKVKASGMVELTLPKNLPPVGHEHTISWADERPPGYISESYLLRNGIKKSEAKDLFIPTLEVQNTHRKRQTYLLMKYKDFFSKEENRNLFNKRKEELEKRRKERLEKKEAASSKAGFGSKATGSKTTNSKVADKNNKDAQSRLPLA